jgi:hypothetical protein
MKSILILYADSALGEVVLPQLHTIVKFVVARAISVFSHPDLKHPIRQMSVDGIATTQYLVEDYLPGGHMMGSLWLSDDGIPMNSRQFILAGRLDQAGLIQRIAKKEFAVVQLRADICDDLEAASSNILHHRRKFNRFTDDVLYTIDRYYPIAWRSQDGTFYIPK